VHTLHEEKYANRSNRDAASRIFEELVGLGRLNFNITTYKLDFDGRLALQTDDPELRFAKWIGAAKRSKL
jgi:hypothetical protein